MFRAPGRKPIVGSCFLCLTSPEKRRRKTRKACYMCKKPICDQHTNTISQCFQCSLVDHRPDITITPQFRNNTLGFVCRTCLKNYGTYFDIFNHTRNNMLLADILASCTSITIRKEDGFPVKICNHCMEKLTSAFDFKTMVIASNTKLHESYRCEGIKKEGELRNDDMGDVCINREAVIKTEPITVADFHCKSKGDGLGNVVIKEEPNDKAEFEFVSLEANCGFLDDFAETISSSESLFKAGKVQGTASVADLRCKNVVAQANGARKEVTDATTQLELQSWHNSADVSGDLAGAFIKTEQTTITDLSCKDDDTLRNRATNEGQLGFESLEEYDGFLSESTKTSSSSGYPSNERNSEMVEVVDLRRENKDALEKQANKPNQYSLLKAQLEFVSSDEYDRISVDSIGANLSLDPSTIGNGQEVGETTPAVKRKKKQTDEHEKHADLLDNPDYKRLRSSGMTRKQRMSETVFCAECNKTFSYRRYVTFHAYIHTGMLPFKCDKCEKRFPQEFVLRAHVQTHFQTRDFACEVCGKAFFQKHHLQNHTAQKHSEERPYKCNICKSTFKRSWHLTEHLVRHTNDKKCEMCGEIHMKRFNHHKDGHVGENKFVCVTCGKVCPTKRRLNYHLKTHLGGKPPYICNYCGRSFLQSSCLNDHIVLHTDTKPFAC